MRVRGTENHAGALPQATINIAVGEKTNDPLANGHNQQSPLANGVINIARASAREHLIEH